MRTHHGHAVQARILVADSHRANARTLSAILDRAGHQVVTSFDGEEAVVTAQGFTPDLFITQPFMDRLSGVEAAATVITVALPARRMLFLSRDGSTFAYSGRIWQVN